MPPLDQTLIGLESFFKADGANWGPDQTWSVTAGASVSNHMGTCSSQSVGEFITVACSSLEADTVNVAVEFDLNDWVVAHANSEIGAWVNFYGATSGRPPGAGKGSVGGGWQLNAGETGNVLFTQGGLGAAGAAYAADPGDRFIIEAEEAAGDYEIRVFANGTLLDSDVLTPSDSLAAPAPMVGPLRFEIGIYRYNFSGSDTVIFVDSVVFADLILEAPDHHATSAFAMRAS